MKEIISTPTRQGKSLQEAMRLYKEVQKLPKNKLYGITHIGYNGFALSKQMVVSYDKIINEIKSIEYAIEDAEDEKNEKAIYFYNAQIQILKKLLKE
jgi:hypothetical protein